MSRSSFVEVNITHSTKLAQDSQNTADNAVKGVTNLNDPNLMSVIEKQTAVSKYAGLTSQYNVILARAKDANISTTDLTTAYTNLNNFMATILTDTTKASGIDRDTYMRLTYDYNAALSNVQTALKDSFNADIDNMQSSVSVASQAASSAAIVASQAATTGDNASHAAEQARIAASQAQIAGDNATSVANNASQAASGATSVATNASQAASQATSSALLVGSQASYGIAVQSTATAKAQSTADNAFSQAQTVGKQASAGIAAQSTATAKAQSTADNAFSQATTAIDTGKVTSQAVTDLKDGSKLTIAELENGLATKVANSDYASYKTQTASQIGQLVTNGAFSAYQQTTADLIASKVANKDFTAYQATTAKSIESKVESSDFNTYKTQTADTIASKVATKDFSAYQSITAKSIESKVESSDFNTYKTQTADLIAEKVANKDFSTYKTQTADLISAKVATKDFTAYQDTTAKAISSKVESSDFNTYKTQTADTISQTVTNAISNISIGGTNLISNSANIITINGDSEHYRILYFNLAPGTWTFSSSAKYTQGSATAVSVLVYDAGHKNAIISNNTVNIVNDRLTTTFTITDYAAKELLVYAGNNGYVSTTGNILQLDHYKLEKGNKATDWSPAPEDLATQSQFTQLSDDINLRVKKGDLVDQINIQAGNTLISSSGKLTLSGKSVFLDSVDPVIMKSANIANLAVGTAQIGDGAITNAKIGKLAVGTAQIANAAITDAQIGDVSANKLTAGTIDFNTITGKNINASNITTGKLSTERLNVNKLSAVSANLGDVTTGSLKGVDIVANTFSTPNGSFTTDSNGAITAKSMALTDGKVSSSTISASTINGSTINGTTFNAGTRLNSYGNTSYPLTINQDGSVTSTSFGNIANDPAALRTVMKDGMVKTNFRGMNKISNGIYSAADIAMGAGQLALFEGYTKSQDPNFTATGITPTGYVILDASTGLNLHGDNQKIHFNGTSADTTPKGIAFTPYGNINATGTQGTWYIGNNSNMLTASFGIDNAGSRDITFYRELDVGNLHINTAHTFASADGQAINFAKGGGGLVDIKANTVHYNSLSKLSLLSVKKDVKKVDTAYWAQLVNSIDLATYQYKSDDNTSHIRLSSIVDDVNKDKQWKLPDVFVTRDEEGKLNGVDESVLLNATLATVQEQQKEIDQLNGHNMELEARLNKLEVKLNG